MQKLPKEPQFDEIYVFPIMWKFRGIKEGSLIPCIIDSGLDENNKFFTACGGSKDKPCGGRSRTVHSGIQHTGEKTQSIQGQ